MSYARRNPYISLEELREELKMKADDIPSGSAMEDDLLRAIDNASRWVDDYTRRDYFFHDHTTVQMEFDNFGDGVYGLEIFPRVRPIISLTRVNLNGVDLTNGTDYFVKTNAPDEQRIISLIGNWFSKSQSIKQTIKVYGTFGYLQNSSFPITVAGDTAGQLSGFSLYGNVVGAVYWGLDSPETNVARVQLFSDSTHLSLIAEGKTAVGGTAINLWAMNGSGISGTGHVSYTVADVDAANIFTPGAGVYDPSTIPIGLPGRIILATRLVAAAISGRNKKEIVDLAGQKTTISESEIPKTVFQILGRRSPVLI